jgi:hypothetical protein
MTITGRSTLNIIVEEKLYYRRFIFILEIAVAKFAAGTVAPTVQMSFTGYCCETHAKTVNWQRL